MPRHLFKRYAPDPKAIHEHKQMKKFGKLLHDPNIWHMNHRSVSGGFAIGMFWAMIPIPGQMFVSAGNAIFFRMNLPVAAASVWISNPLTMPPIFYFNHQIGAWLLSQEGKHSEFELSIEWIFSSIGQIWQPLLLGSLVSGIILSSVSYLGIRAFWNWYTIRQYKNRRL